MVADVTHGLPQGTVLAPMLFIIYINNINLIDADLKIVSYADDTTLIINGKNWEDTFQKATVAMHNLKKWLDQYQLVLNSTKTKFIPFSINEIGQPNINQIIIHEPNCFYYENCQCSSKILITENIKYLGVNIDNKLKWDVHIKNLNNRIRKLIYKFYDIRNILDSHNITTIYYALVESLLRYAIVAWGGASRTFLSPLKVTQNYILKIIYKKNKRYSTSLLYKDSGIMNIASIYAHSVIKFIHINVQYKIKYTHNFNTRNQRQNNIMTPKYNKSFCQRFFSFNGPVIYNKLPNDIRNIKNNKKFVKITKDFILKNYEIFKLN